RRIIRVEAHSTPEDAANLGGDGFRKRAVEPDEAVGDEGVDVGRAQRGRGGWKGGHGVLSNAPACEGSRRWQERAEPGRAGPSSGLSSANEHHRCVCQAALRSLSSFLSAMLRLRRLRWSMNRMPSRWSISCWMQVA